ncbi:MAG TPA: isoprenylcysteine carboxylmethyltransferase family protein [bacterium]
MISLLSIIGKPTIHPFLFFSGKISGYLAWILFLLIIFNVEIIGKQYDNILINILSFVILSAGLAFIVLSNVNLGRSNRLGLPEDNDNTALKTGGIYRISRNPMYVGFNLLTLSSIIYSANILIAIPGVYSIFIYHLIILGEEKFLKARFGASYADYKKKVRRYV